jgi:hypothetical protein
MIVAPCNSDVCRARYAYRVTHSLSYAASCRLSIVVARLKLNDLLSLIGGLVTGVLFRTQPGGCEVAVVSLIGTKP